MHIPQPNSLLNQTLIFLCFCFVVGNQKTSRAVLAAVFPHPLRFKQAWHLARGDKFLYAWRAVPPEGFLALGNICSTTGEHSIIDKLACLFCVEENSYNIV